MKLNINEIDILIEAINDLLDLTENSLKVEKYNGYKDYLQGQLDGQEIIKAKLLTRYKELCGSGMINTNDEKEQ